MSARLCPKCRAPMKQESVRGIVIDRCASCKGAWYDWKEIESILGSQRTLLRYVPPESQMIYKGKALCPVCSDPMNVLRENPVFAFDIDFCEKEHGIWLDALEFEKVRAVVEKSRYRFKKTQETASRETNLQQKDLEKIEERLVTHLQREKYYQNWITWSLIGFNAFVFCWFFFQGALASAIADFGFIPEKFSHDPLSNAWTSVTALFLHGNPVHLLVNLLFLFLIGEDLETRLGKIPFLALYLTAGAATFVPDSFYRTDAHFPHMGSGGAISALLGTYLLLFSKNQCLIVLRNIVSGKTLKIPPQIYLPAWFVLQWICSLSGVQGAGFRSHLTGFALGVVFGVGWKVFSKKTPSHQR